MQTITIYNEKGGVGKTTIASILGAGLAIKGYRVLLIDADQQGDLSKNMKIPKHAGFYNFVKRNDPNSPDYVETGKLLLRPPEDKHPKNLYLIAGNGETGGIVMSTKLKDIVQSMAGRMAQLEKVFDYCIIDTQPSASTLHDAIALISDHFIIPTQPEPLSAYGGVKEAKAHVLGVHEQSLANGRNKANLMAIIPNMVDERTKLHQHVLKTLIEEHGDLIWDSIPKRINISEAQLLQTTTMFDEPEFTVNKYLWNFINRVERETQEEEQSV